MCPPGQNHSLQEQKKVGNGGTPRGSFFWDNLTDQVTFTNENSKVESRGFPQGSRALLCPFWWWTDLFPLPLLSSYLSELRSLWALSNPFIFWGSDPRTSAQWIPKGFLLILAMLTVKHETEQTEVVGMKTLSLVNSWLVFSREPEPLVHTLPHTPTYKHTETGLRQRKRFPFKHCLLAESCQYFFCPVLYLFMFWEAISSSPSGAPKRVNIRFVVLPLFFPVDPAPGNICWLTVIFFMMSLPVSPGLSSQSSQPPCL